MNGLLFLILGYFCLVLSSTVLIFGNTSYYHIDFIPALLSWYGINETPCRGMIFVILFAAIAAAVSILPFGIFAFAYLLSFFTVLYIKSNMLDMSYWHLYILTAILSVEIQGILLIWSQHPELFWPQGIYQTILTLIISPFLFFTLTQITNLMNVFSRSEDGAE